MSEDKAPSAVVRSGPRWPVRLGLALATLVYCVYSSFGIAAPLWWGHHGYHGATYMLRARMSLRLHMLAPATWGGFEPPPVGALYFHHPIGYHHLLTLLIPLFGDHAWLPRLLAAAGGLVCLWALYALVGRFWSREAGLAAVVIFITLPILTSFSVLSDPMLLEMACVLWSLSAYLSLLERPTTRALWHAFFAYALGGLLMWEVYFIGPFIALHSLGYLLTRRGRSLKFGRYHALIVHTLVIGGACVLMMALHLWFTHHAGAWEEFLDSYRIRKTPQSTAYVIERHKLWLQLLYGRPPVIVGALWLCGWLIRLVIGQARRRDIAIFTFLYINTIYIIMFAEGSSVHLYRVFFYSAFFTLAGVDLLSDAYRLALRRLDRLPAAALVATSLLGLYLVCEVPHALHNLVESRVMMGTHGEAHYSPEREKLRFAEEVHRRTLKSDRVILHYPHLGARKEFWYYLDRNYDEIQTLAQLPTLQKTLGRSVLIFDEVLLSPAERTLFERLLEHHPVTFFDRFTMVDLRSSIPGVHGYTFVAERPSLLYRWFVSHVYPPLALAPRVYLPGACAGDRLGVVTVAGDALLPPVDASLWPCYRNLAAARGAAAEVAVAEEHIKGLWPEVRLPLGTAEVRAAGVRERQLQILFSAHGAAAGPLAYRLVRDRRSTSTLSSLPPPSRWQDKLYLERLPLSPGRSEITVELGAAPTPTAPAQRLHSAPLGSFML